MTAFYIIISFYLFLIFFAYFFFLGFLIAQPFSLKSGSSPLKSLLPFLKNWR